MWPPGSPNCGSAAPPRAPPARPIGSSRCCSTSPCATGGSLAIPLSGSRSPRIVRGEPRFLTRTEVEGLADAAGDDGDVIRLLAYTGLRFRELAALRVRRVDFLRLRLTVSESATEVGGKLVFGKPKTHQQRSVPLPAVLVEALARRYEVKPPDDLLVTTAAGTALRLRNWRRVVWDPAVRAAGLSDVTRTTCGTRPPPSRPPAGPTSRAFSGCSGMPRRR